uniref:CUB domain-containing protein n=1 Tax=Glossina austeni TaxID=7395 RepID=A0A1A9VMY9_GLOAU
MLTRTNFVTLKYVTDNWGTDANGFKLVITSVKDPKHTCKDFTCSTTGFCIHPDLLCDGINHCSDNSDESVHNLCQSETTNTVFGMDVTWFVLIVVSLLLILSAIIVGISICVCRRQEDNTTNQNTAIQLFSIE